jgi:hypothetical protein
MEDAPPCSCLLEPYSTPTGRSFMSGRTTCQTTRFPGLIDDDILLAIRIFKLISLRPSASLFSPNGGPRQRELDNKNPVLVTRLHALGDLSRQSNTPASRLAAQVHLNSVAGAMPAMQSAWNTVNAFLTHRDGPGAHASFSRSPPVWQCSFLPLHSHISSHQGSKADSSNDAVPNNEDSQAYPNGDHVWQRLLVVPVLVSTVQLRCSRKRGTDRISSTYSTVECPTESRASTQLHLNM